MEVSTLKKCQAEPAAFRAHLLIDGDAGPVPLREALVGNDWQRDDFAATDPLWLRCVGASSSPHNRAWLERPRGHSKTSDQAVMVAWVLFASRRRLSGVCAAADLDQAKLLRDAVSRLVQLNPWLAEFLEVEQHCIRNPHTGSEARIISSDAATSYGLLVDFVVIDEITHWKRRDLWDSLISSAAKRDNCVVVVITNAGFGESWQHEARTAILAAANWYFRALRGPIASWITADRLAEQKRLLPAVVFARLWLNRWTAGAGDAIEETLLLAALNQRVSRPAVAAGEQGFSYVAGLDLGLSRDASALVIVGRHVGWTERLRRAGTTRPRPALTRAMIDCGILEPSSEPAGEVIHHDATGRYCVALVQVWRPAAGRKVSIEEVEAAILDANKTYDLAAVAYDPWQAEYLSERLLKAGVQTEPVQFTPANLQSMAQVTLETFTEKNIDIPPDPNLIADLRSLRVEERSYGIRLNSPRGPNGHGDTATGLALGLHAAKRFAFQSSNTVRGRLVCFPQNSCEGAVGDTFSSGPIASHLIQNGAR